MFVLCLLKSKSDFKKDDWNWKYGSKDTINFKESLAANLVFYADFHVAPYLKSLLLISSIARASGIFQSKSTDFGICLKCTRCTTRWFSRCYFAAPYSYIKGTAPRKKFLGTAWNYTETDNDSSRQFQRLTFTSLDWLMSRWYSFFWYLPFSSTCLINIQPEDIVCHSLYQVHNLKIYHLIQLP